MPKKQPWYVQFFRRDHFRYRLAGDVAAAVSPERTQRDVAFVAQEPPLVVPAREATT